MPINEVYYIPSDANVEGSFFAEKPAGGRQNKKR